MTASTLDPALPSPLDRSPVLDRRRLVHHDSGRPNIPERRLYPVRIEDLFSFQVAPPTTERKRYSSFRTLGAGVVLFGVFSIIGMALKSLKAPIAVSTEQAVYEWVGFYRMAPN
jgi:hypothetical protein